MIDSISSDGDPWPSARRESRVICARRTWRRRLASAGFALCSIGSLWACGDRRIVFCDVALPQADGGCGLPGVGGAGGGAGRGGAAGALTAGAGGAGGEVTLGGSSGFGGFSGAAGSGGGAPLPAGSPGDAGVDGGEPVDAAVAP